jgi:dinuclear metal center YbgI/SA1388 family protein
MQASVGSIVEFLDAVYPQSLAADWDRVGLQVGDPDVPVRRILCVIDCVPETVAEAIAADVDLIVAHHPLLLRGVHSVATTTYKGRIVHDLIGHGIGLFVAHTNADCAPGGVAEALFDVIGLADMRALGAESLLAVPGRIGRLPVPMTFSAFVDRVAAALPATAAGLRAAGDPSREISTVAISPGAGDTYLAAAQAAGVDAYLTADLRHHPAGEHIAAGGPALVDASHWATEWPWLAGLAGILTAGTGIGSIVSTLNTDPWTMHAHADGYGRADS